MSGLVFVSLRSGLIKYETLKRDKTFFTSNMLKLKINYNKRTGQQIFMLPKKSLKKKGLFKEGKNPEFLIIKNLDKRCFK